MKRKLFSIFMVVAIAVISIFGFAACDSPDGGDKNDGSQSSKITSVTLSSDELYLSVGETKNLVAIVYPYDATAKSIEWKSSDETVATVTNGAVTGIKKGTATVTVTADGKSASCFVTVSAAVTFTDFVMPEGGFDTTKPVTIKFYHTMGTSLRKVLEYGIEEFNELYPNITVDDVQVGGYDDVVNRVSLELITGEQPNIAYCYPDHVAKYNEFGAVLPLNGFLPDGEYKDITVTQKDETKVALGLMQAEKDDYIQGYFQEGFNYGDGSTLYSLPFSKSTEVLYYNKTFFDENNLPVPETWEEMGKVCAKIKELKPDCTPLGYDSEANLFITMCAQSGSDYTSSSGEHYLFDNEINRDFVAMFKDWVDAGYLTTKSIDGFYTSNIFSSEKCFMSIGSSAGAINYMAERVSEEYRYEVGIAQIPQIDKENPKVISQGPSVCIFKQDDPQEVIASWLLVKYLTTNVKFQAMFSDYSGYVPVINSVFEHPVVQDNFARADGYGNLRYLALKTCMEQAASYFTPPAFLGSNTARDEVGDLMVAVFKGEKTLDQAFKDAIDECKYRYPD